MTPDEVVARLKASLVEAGGDDVIVEEVVGPLDTTLIRARASGMYPGANARTALLDGDRAYGLTLERGLAGFLADRNLDAGSLTAEILLDLYRLLHLDGALVLDSGVTPTRSDSGSAVVIHFAARDPMSGASSAQELVVPYQGPVMLRAAPEGADVTPISRAVGLERALEGHDALAMMAALGAMRAPFSAAERGLIARCAATPNETIAYDAVARLDALDASADALRAATDNDADARARVVAYATSAHGAAFAHRIGS